MDDVFGDEMFSVFDKSSSKKRGKDSDINSDAPNTKRQAVEKNEPQINVEPIDVDSMEIETSGPDTAGTCFINGKKHKMQLHRRKVPSLPLSRNPRKKHLG